MAGVGVMEEVAEAALVEGEALAAEVAVPQAAALEAAGNSIYTMNVKHFFTHLEHDRVHRAIRAAETGTSGDIVLYITHAKVEDPLAAANEQFRKLHLETVTDKNSFLIFLAPKSQKFAMVGGTALHEKVGQAWWDELVALLTLHFKANHYTEGLIATIERAGIALRKHFPASAENRTGQKDIVEE